MWASCALGTWGSPLRPDCQILPLGPQSSSSVGLCSAWQADAEGTAGEQPAFLSQHSDSDSDPEYLSLPPSIPSAVPVTGESFCNCDNQSEASFCSSLYTAAHRGRDCRCGEEDECKRLAGVAWAGWGRPLGPGEEDPARAPETTPAWPFLSQILTGSGTT